MESDVTFMYTSRSVKVAKSKQRIFAQYQSLSDLINERYIILKANIVLTSVYRNHA